MIRLIPLALVASLGACSDSATQQKVADLENRLAAAEKALAEGGGAAKGEDRDQQAIALYREAQTLGSQDKNDEAKAKYRDCVENFGDTKVARACAAQLRQLEVVGSEIANLSNIEWLAGQSDIDEGKATLVVFWELWCPHCKREVPKLQETFTKFKGQGFNVVSLTKMSRGKTKDEILAFMKEEGVSYPVGKEDGSMSEFFGVQGVPAAAVVKDGKVVWRDHPARITDAMIQGWIGG